MLAKINKRNSFKWLFLIFPLTSIEVVNVALFRVLWAFQEQLSGNLLSWSQSQIRRQIGWQKRRWPRNFPSDRIFPCVSLFRLLFFLFFWQIWLMFIKYMSTFPTNTFLVSYWKCAVFFVLYKQGKKSLSSWKLCISCFNNSFIFNKLIKKKKYWSGWQVVNQ